MVYGTVRGVYNHKSGHIDSRERSWCVMVCRDRSTDVRFCHPFRSLFADFRRFSPLKAHIDFFSLKFTQNESNFKMLYLIEFLFNKNSEQ